MRNRLSVTHTSRSAGRAPRVRSASEGMQIMATAMPAPRGRNEAPARTLLSRLVHGAAGLALLAAGAIASDTFVPGSALIATPAAAQNSIVSIGQGDAVQRVDLGLNKSLVIDLPEDAFDILVANPAVADAVARSSRRIYLFGKTVGETNIFVFGEDGQPIANIELRIERDVANLEGDLERFIPGSDITVEIVNDNIVLSGSVLTAQDANRAEQLANAFLNGGEQGSRGQGDGLAALFGADQSSSIVNLLTILGENQVTLKLTVAEIQRSVVKQLGINLNGSINASALNSDLLSGLNGSTSVRGETSAGLVNGRGFSLGGQIGPDDFGLRLNAQIEALNDTGVMRTLAEPTLTAVSGESAAFRVGGTYNILGGIDVDAGETIVDDGVVITTPPTRTLEQREINYGVSLGFRPVVLSSGRISIKLRTEVSEPTPVGSNPVANGTFLSLRQREAETTVELPSGGTMMIAGLIRDDVRQTLSRTPGLSNVPILGSLFRSRSFVREETELVILATPYLVRPVPRNKLARPDDNFHAVNDTKGYLLGRVNEIYGNRKSPDAPYHGAVGFIYK